MAKENNRRHDMDLLRALAMLMGIAFHTALAYNGDFWFISDPDDHVFFQWFCDSSHGFRMPLFFVISGFFTTMILKKYGLKKLLNHRFKRIFLPCIVAVLIFGNANRWVVVHAMKQEQLRVQESNISKETPEYLTLSKSDVLEDAETSSFVQSYYKIIDKAVFKDSFFSHMWFLWFLSLQVILFVFLVLVWRKTNLPLNLKFIQRPYCLLVLIPLSYFTQFFMHPGKHAFGPDTSLGLLPYPHTFLYYTIFFIYGCLLFGRENKIPKNIKGSVLTILACLSSVIFIKELQVTHRELSNFLQVTYTWIMIFSCMDLSRYFIKKENRLLRYFSDASYWLYLAHLPLVFLGQHIVRHWDVNIFAKFLILNFMVFLILFISYHYLVRSTFVGSFLNGRRYPLKS